GKLAPENTLAAFRHGASFGFRAFECDVKLSADEVPFLLHDATLERTTSGQGTAGDRPWAALSRLDAGRWHSPAYAGEPLPTLDAVAAYIIANRFALNIEIKPTPGAEHGTGRVVAEQVRRLWAGQTQVPLLSSFRPEALLAAKNSAPELPRALLVDTLWPGWLAMAQSLACVAVVANHKLADADWLAQLRATGMRGLCYTVNESADAERLQSLGIDGLITDAVDRFKPA
ncbi:MAG: glycerophosphodiester phosphodiesterase, partial [Burkholderiales bacterium]|nr:glycerophosphodiester phosphodiesterase [Burkholderiales bacterium]